MIQTPEESDFDGLSCLIATSIDTCISADRSNLLNIQNHSIDASRSFIDKKFGGVHLVYKNGSEVKGLVLVKDHWNMVSLFVWPDSQRKGIATRLVNKAVEVCRTHSSKDMIALNSSTYASGFYERYGFLRNGLPRDLPGGCIPYVYYL